MQSVNRNECMKGVLHVVVALLGTNVSPLQEIEILVTLDSCPSPVTVNSKYGSYFSVSVIVEEPKIYKKWHFVILLHPRENQRDFRGVEAASVMFLEKLMVL